MHLFSVAVSLLAAVAIIGIGIGYLIAPTMMMRSFGLPVPTPRDGLAWWLRLKGTRDLATGLVVFAIFAWGDYRLLGIVVAILAVIPVGDMSVVFGGGGSAKTALGVHGLTAILMIAAGVLMMVGSA